MMHVLSIIQTHLPVLPSPRPLRRRPVALLGLVLTLALAGCAGETGAPAPEPAEPESSAKSYETRGIVRQLPKAGTPGSQLFIHHEAIPSFESFDGEVTGMDAMAMEFPIADTKMLDGLSVGDKVAFTLRIDWDESPPLEITRLEKLPPETLLSFEKADGEEGEEDGHAAHAPTGEHAGGHG